MRSTSYSDAPNKMLHRLAINLLSAESAKEVFFAISSSFEVVPFKNDKIFLLSDNKDSIGSIFVMNINLDSSGNSEISRVIKAMSINHFGYTITDMTNDRITFGESNINREARQVSPYRENAQNISK